MTLRGPDFSVAYFDPIFWSITIDGRAATTRDIADLERKPLTGCAVDGSKRLLSLGLS